MSRRDGLPGRGVPARVRHSAWAAMLVAAAYAVVALVVGWAREPGLAPVAVTGEFVAAVLAAGAAFRTAERCSGERRRAWVWLGLGAGAWALGEAWWVLQEVLLERPLSVPSPADVGFLLLPPCAAMALLLHPAARAAWPSQRLMLLLDGVAVTLAMLLIAWDLPIAAVLRSSTGHLAMAVAVAYPVSDAMLVAIVCILLTHRRGRQASLFVLQAGLMALAGADSIFCVLTADGAVSALSPADVLWIAGFLAIALAAALDARPVPVAPEGSSAAAGRKALPYILTAAAGLAVFVEWLAGRPIGFVSVALLTAMILLTFLRQYLLLRDNRRLADQVRWNIEQLHHSRARDARTGLPNRVGLLELLDRILRDSDGQPLALVTLRPVRLSLLDGLPAAQADELFGALAAAIQGCLGPADQLSRPAESTFAVVVAGDEQTAVRRVGAVMRAVQTPLRVGEGRLPMGLAAGIAVAPAAGDESTATTLLQQANMALSSVAGSVGAFAVFTPEMLYAHNADLRLWHELVRTLRTDPAACIEVAFEPVIAMPTGALTGLAASPLWHGGDGLALPAGRLLALAREAGLASRVDETVLSVAIDHFAQWTRDSQRTCRQIWVTVCTETLGGDRFVERVLGMLAAARLPACALVLDRMGEVDERTGNERCRQALRDLRAAGVALIAANALALSGHSDAIDATYVEIPPAMVAQCVDDMRVRHLVEATVEFADSRRATGMARGVASIEQHESLRDLGCGVACGPLYGTAMSVAAAAELVAAAAATGWQSPVGLDVAYRRSSRAWQELRQVINSLPVAAFACDTTGALVLAEGALLDEMGGKAVLGRPLTALLDGADAGAAATGAAARQSARAVLSAALEQALGGSPAVSLLPLGGRWLQVFLSPGSDSDGTVSGTLGVAIDVTHQFEAEQAMRRSERRFREVFARAPVGIALFDREGRLQEVNPALAAMLGEEPDDLVGRSVRSLVHSESSGTDLGPYEDLLAGRVASYRVERAYRHRDGSPVYARVTVGSLGGGDPGSSAGAVSIVEDLSQIRKLEVDLRHAQKLEAVGSLAAGIAHEINTPTQFVADNLTFLADAFGQLAGLIDAAAGSPAAPEAPAVPGWPTPPEAPAPAVPEAPAPAVPVAAAAGLPAVPGAEADVAWLLAEVPNAISQSQDGIQRVASIVKAMRTFGHPDNLQATPIDINAAIRDTAVVARNEYKYVADLCLELGEVPAVLGYPSEFQQVILNLVVNAAHAVAERGGSRGTIRIRSWAGDGRVHLAVSDDGCGMTRRVLDRIFEPFYTTKPVGKGTGQGLAIVHSVVEKHHGTIDVRTEPGQGSTFTVNLPLAGQPSCAASPGGAQAEPGSGGASAGAAVASAAKPLLP